ncbi:MAG TPA: DUF2793 domain-containing protein [Allosphingosinicella sp.]|nr:DUF2793 domain-containing protein [Allosphingosinicella sp.]
MADTTPRFGLPFILPGQAQKELFHNEALILIDLAVQPAVEGPPADSPPPAPLAGQCWIVAAGATGDWAGRDDEIALWTEAGWRFLPPGPGMNAWNKAEGVPLVFDGTGWGGGELACSGILVDGLKVVGERQPAVASPSGGTIIDSEARAAIAALIAALMSHGLIA